VPAGQIAFIFFLSIFPTDPFSKQTRHHKHAGPANS